MCRKHNFSNGWFIFRRCRLVFFSLLFLLRATASVYAQTVTNVDFLVVGSLYQLFEGYEAKYVYDKFPTGPILFWTVLFDENQERGSIYRSQSGHIGWIDGNEFVIAGGDGKPMTWSLRSRKVRFFDARIDAPTYFNVPSYMLKDSFDVIGVGGFNGRICLFRHTPASSVYNSYTYAGNMGSVYLEGITSGAGSYKGARIVYLYVDEGVIRRGLLYGEEEDFYSLRYVWRHPDFDISLEEFTLILESTWWLRDRYTVSSFNGVTGITGINTLDGGGMGRDNTRISNTIPSGGGAAPGDVASVPLSVSGDPFNPPTTPLGDNGRWVYDPEKKLWQWQGDLADNANRIDPYDNSVMPENSGTIEGKWATESTLRRVLQTLEGFQKEQGITPEQLQAMIDSGVVSIVDGMVQYWEGKHIPQAIASVGDKIDSAAQSISDSSSSAANQVSSSIAAASDQIRRKMNDDYSGLSGHIAANSAYVNNVKRAVDSGTASIVGAINGLEFPSVDIPTAEVQDFESYDAPVGDVDSLGNDLFSLVFPGVAFASIPVVSEFPDWDVGVFDWIIPFSYFSYSRNPQIYGVLSSVRTVLKWLIYLSVVISGVRMLGGGE